MCSLLVVLPAQDCCLKQMESADHMQYLQRPEQSLSMCSGLVVVNLPVSPRGCRALQLVQACLDEQLDLHAASCVCRIAQNVDWPMPRFSCRPELQWGIYIEIFRRRPSQAGRSTAELVA